MRRRGGRGEREVWMEKEIDEINFSVDLVFKFFIHCHQLVKIFYVSGSVCRYFLILQDFEIREWIVS